MVTTVLLFALPVFTMYILKNNFLSYFTLLYRLFKKMMKKTNKYTVPALTAYDYPIPPYPNAWYPICLSNELQRGALQKKKIAGKEFIVFRDENGVVSAINKNCSHMGVDLSYGTVKNGCVVCPFHHHCVKPHDDSAAKQEYFIEETNNIIFIWVGEDKPFYSIREIVKTYNCPEGTPYLSSYFTRNVGGAFDRLCGTFAGCSPRALYTRGQFETGWKLNNTDKIFVCYWILHWRNQCATGLYLYYADIWIHWVQ